MNTIKAYWWNTVNNFGDVISRPILEHVTGCKVELAPVDSYPKVLCTGSTASRLGPGDVAFGCGVYSQSTPVRPMPGVAYQALRGPLSAKKLGHYPVTFGDPGLLLPLVYKPTFDSPYKCSRLYASNVKGFFGGDWAQRELGCEKFVSMSDPWQDIADAFVSAGLVYTNSLHALIVCEAYGVPVIWVADPQIPRFKFNDYLAGTGRAPILIDRRPPPAELSRSDLGAIQDGLMRAGRHIGAILEARGGVLTGQSQVVDS